MYCVLYYTIFFVCLISASILKSEQCYFLGSDGLIRVIYHANLKGNSVISVLIISRAMANCCFFVWGVAKGWSRIETGMGTKGVTSLAANAR